MTSDVERGEADYGYSAINWEGATPENVAAVEDEYRLRLREAAAGWSNPDEKARFVLTGLIGLTTALTGWAYVNVPEMEPPYAVGIVALTTILAAAAGFAALSLRPQTYTLVSGVTPIKLDVAAWAPLLNGNDREMLRLQGVRIKEFARGIVECDRANATKSRWLRLAIGTAVLAFPLSSAALAIAALIDFSHFAAASPVWLWGIAAVVVGILWRFGLWFVSRS